MLLLAAWTACCLGLGCLVAGGQEKDGTPLFREPWTPLGWSMILWACGLLIAVVVDLILGRLY